MANPVGGDLTGRILGDFEILRPIGRGGMGIVNEARQVSLNRTVALKVLGGGLGLTHRAVARFRREAEAAARLHHTDIVPVYATGEDHGAHFYAMELIAGPSLDRVLDGPRKDRAGPATPAEPGSNGDSPSLTGPLPAWVSEAIDYGPAVMPRTHAPPADGASLNVGAGYFDRVAAMVADVADALNYAHRNGVIHRDIKPSNLLLSPDGRLSINDFGLARMLEEPGMTLTGEFVGTPKYMSPEQITAGRAPLDHRTDIYSLGATLYEMLTLCPPYSGSRRDEVIGQIIHKEPTPPRRLDRRIPVDLEAICLKAMDKDPDRRYQTAGEMAEDLWRYVNRYAISARRAGPLTRARKWVRRNPALAAALGCVLVAVAAAGVLAVQAHLEREAHRRDQIRQLFSQAYGNRLDGRFDDAEDAVKEAELPGASTGVVRLLRGMTTFHGGDPDGALGHLDQAVKLLHRERDPEWLIRARGLRAFINGALMRYEENFGEVDWLLSQPHPTPDEKYYIGMAVTISDPQRGFDLMKEFLTAHGRDLVARRVGANFRVYRAIDTGRREDITEALERLGDVETLLPDSPYTIRFLAYAHCEAAILDRKQGRRTDELKLADAALKRAEALELTRDWFYALRAHYFDLLDDPSSALATLRDGHERMPSNRALNFYYAMALYRVGRSGQALEVLDNAAGAEPSLWLDLPLALLQAERPDRRDEAATLARALARRRPPGLDPLFAPTVLLLLGRDGEARAMWRDYRRAGPPLPVPRREFFQKLLDYGCGDRNVDEPALLTAAGTSHCNQCEAHFFIAMTKLAEGNRGEAKAHFRKARDTHVTWMVDSLAWELSRSFFSRMEADPTWPAWIKASPKPYQPLILQPDGGRPHVAGLDQGLAEAIASRPSLLSSRCH